MNSFKKFYTGQNYNQHMYNGLIGFFMKLSHKKMEKNKEKKSKVLEIGPGTHPHTDYLSHEFDEYHVAEKIEELSDFYKDKDKVIFATYDGEKLPFEDNFFDRIILSHCLEHILEPEKILQDTFNLIDDDGLLWTGYVFKDKKYWPIEKPSWTMGAAILAGNAINKFSPSSDFFAL